MSSFDIKNFWSIVKSVRKSFIREKPPSLLCYEFGFLKDSEIKEITNSLEEMLMINASVDAYDNVTEEVLESGGEMLLYLASCPGPALLSWKEFYKEMFGNFDLQNMILTLNRILKSSDGNIHEIAESLIAEVRSSVDISSGMILIMGLSVLPIAEL